MLAGRVVRQQSQNCICERTLAAARLSQDSNDFAFPDREAEVIDGTHFRPAAKRIGDRQSSNFAKKLARLAQIARTPLALLFVYSLVYSLICTLIYFLIIDGDSQLASWEPTKPMEPRFWGVTISVKMIRHFRSFPRSACITSGMRLPFRGPTGFRLRLQKAEVRATADQPILGTDRFLWLRRQSLRA